MNPIEERIAAAMAQVPRKTCRELWAERVVESSKVRGLTAAMVLTGKTPKKVAEIWLHSCMSSRPKSSVPAKKQEAQAALGTYPLLPYSQMVHDLLQQNPNIYFFPITLRFRASEVDVDRLSEATERAFRNHPAFSIDTVCYYTYGIELDDEGEYGYWRLIINRILGDATSLQILLEDIGRAYMGKRLQPDYYYTYLKRYFQHTQSQEYADHGQWLHEQFDAIDCPLCPTPDTPIEAVTGDWLAGEYTLPLALSERSERFGERVPKGQERGFNEIFCLATALATMDYCHTDEAALTWGYVGRERPEEQRVFGSLHRDVPMRIRRADTVAKYWQQVHEQISHGIIHSDYPYTLTEPQHQRWRYATNVLVQPNPQDLLHSLPIPLEWYDKPLEFPAPAYSLLDVEIVPAGDQVMVRICYSASHYRAESIEHFADLIRQNAEKMLKI